MYPRKNILLISDIHKVITDYHEKKGRNRKKNNTSAPAIVALEAKFPLPLTPAMKAAKVAELKKIAIAKAKANDSDSDDEQPAIPEIDPNSELDDKQIFQLVTILLEQKLEKGTESEVAFNTLKNKIEKNGAELKLYHGLKALDSYYDQNTVARLYRCEFTEVAKKCVRALELLDEFAIVIQPEKKEYLIERLIGEHSIFSNYIIKLADKKLLEPNIFDKIFNDPREVNHKSLINSLIDLNESKKYERIKRLKLDRVLCKMSGDSQKTVRFFYELSEDKILDEKNYADFSQALIKDYNNHKEESNSILVLKELHRKNILDSKNIINVCKVLSVGSENAYFFELMMKKMSNNIVENKKILEKCCELFLRDEKVANSLSSLIHQIKALNHDYDNFAAKKKNAKVERDYHLVFGRPLLFEDVQNLLLDKAEDIKLIKNILNKAAAVRFSFFQEEAFEKIQKNPQAVEKSIDNLLFPNRLYFLGIEDYIIRYPEYTQLDDFNTVALFLSNVNCFNREILDIIFSMRFVEATIVSLAAFIKGDVAELEKTALIKDFIQAQPKENKQEVQKFAKRIAHSHSDLLAFNRDEKEKIYYNKLVADLIELFRKANQSQIRAAHDFGRVGIQLRFIHANKDSLIKESISGSKNQVLTMINHFLSPKHPVIALDEEIQSEYNKFRYELAGNKYRHLDAVQNAIDLEKELIILIQGMDKNIVKLVADNAKKVEVEQKSGVELVEEKILCFESCNRALLDKIREILVAVLAMQPPVNHQPHINAAYYFDQYRQHIDSICFKCIGFQNGIMQKIQRLKQVIKENNEAKKIPKIIDLHKVEMQNAKVWAYAEAKKKEVAEANRKEVAEAKDIAAGLRLSAIASSAAGASASSAPPAASAASSTPPTTSSASSAPSASSPAVASTMFAAVPVVSSENKFPVLEEAQKQIKIFQTTLKTMMESDQEHSIASYKKNDSFENNLDVLFSTIDEEVKAAFPNMAIEKRQIAIIKLMSKKIDDVKDKIKSKAWRIPITGNPREEEIVDRYRSYIKTLEGIQEPMDVWVREKESSALVSGANTGLAKKL